MSKCDWTTVNEELEKAQEAVAESNAKGKRPHRWFWRALGASSSVVSPGLAAFPDYLCVLHGGMAVIFSVGGLSHVCLCRRRTNMPHSQLARHSAMIRQKILSAFEFIPSTIEMARNMDDNFSLYGSNMKGSQLHIEINKLQKTLIQTIPALINQLCPRTFRESSSTQRCERHCSDPSQEPSPPVPSRVSPSTSCSTRSGVEQRPYESAQRV